MCVRDWRTLVHTSMHEPSLQGHAKSMSQPAGADLSTAATHAFFREQDPALEATIVGMEAVENWTRDSAPQVQQALQALADRIESVDMGELDPDLHNKLIILLSYISSGKALRLLLWIEEFAPNFVARTMAEAQMLAALDKLNEKAAALFVERIEVLERHHVLRRVFAPERLKTMKKVLRILSGSGVQNPDDDEDDDDDDDDA